MDKPGKLTLTLIALVLTPVLALAQERVGDFVLIDQNGYHHSMSYLDDHEAVAFLVQANGSEATEAALSGFLALRDQFDSRGIEFLLINPMGLENRADERGRGTDGAGFAATLRTKRIVSAGLGFIQFACERDEIVGAGHAVIQERACKYLAAIWIVRGAFGQCLTDSLGKPAVNLGMDDHRVDDGADIVDDVIALELEFTGIAVDLDLDYMAAIRIREI